MRTPARAGAALFAVLACARLVAAETIFLVHSDAGDPIGDGQAHRFTPADGTFRTFHLDGGGVWIEMSGEPHDWVLTLVPPVGVPKSQLTIATTVRFGGKQATGEPASTSTSCARQLVACLRD